MNSGSNQKVRFFFVGVGKCGTSWLYSFVRRHQVMSVAKIKEPYVIDLGEDERDQEVDKLYSSKTNMADFSNTYFFDPDNAHKIKQYNPDARIIITIRKPSARIASHFQFIKRNGGLADKTLAEYLAEGDPESLVARSDYHEMINRYVTMFGEDNVLLLPLEQLREDPQRYVDRFLRFCGFDRIVLDEEDVQVVLPRAKARSPWLARQAKHLATVMRKLRFLGLLARLKESPMVRKLLYRPDKTAPPAEFGPMTSVVAAMDSDYVQLLARCDQ